VGHCEGQCETGEIIGLSVSCSHRRQGVGRKLLFLLVDSLRAAGAERVWVVASAGSTAHDHRFYRAVGWEPTGQRVDSDNEVFEPRTEG
jgi:predicted N-acetyltransferase YhbS